MCLTLVAWRAHPVYRLVVATNRDEVYWRPTEPLSWWPQDCILAGRDRPSGGTWAGFTRSGRFASVTNVRDGVPVGDSPAPRSRGLLPTDYLRSDHSPHDYAASVAATGDKYQGFNLLCSDQEHMWWVSNKVSGAREVEPGFHGVSNAALDTPWPKVQSGKAALRAALASDVGSIDSSTEPYFELLHDSRYAKSADLPHTGVGWFAEKPLSARFVRMGVYGTRSSTVLRYRYDGSFDLTERRFNFWHRTGETRIASNSNADEVDHTRQ